MARKSKRENVGKTSVKVETLAKRMPTAAYVRMSSEKEGDSSIQNQISLINDYIKKSEDLVLTETYIDNGFTGTEFERPDFQRMMTDVYNGKIQCIVVKDLSRFGRNLIETGNYLENIFPRLNVRCIAITDDFDSSRPEDLEGISLPIKNMVNEMYAKDFSKKVTAYFELHSRLGDFKIQRPPYGYSVDRKKNILVPDPNTAPVVQMIFRWFLMGVAMNEIAGRLNDRGLPSPYGYKVKNNGYVEIEPLKAHTDKWGHSSVYQILHCEAYKGNRILGKTRTMLYKGLKPHRTSPDKWIRHENTHEALVPASDFDIVTEILGQRRKEYMEKKQSRSESENLFVDYFHEKVYCPECHRKMKYYRNNRERKNTLAFYKCYDGTKAGTTKSRRAIGKAYHGSKNKDGSRRDCGKKIQEDFIKIVVLDAIRNLMKSCCDKKQIVQRVKSSGKCERFQVIQRQRLICEESIVKIQSQLEGLYADYSSGILESEEYLELKEHFLGKERIEKEKLLALNTELRRMEKLLDSYLEWCDRLDSYGADELILEKQMIDELIDAIYIGDNYEVEIRFKCSDVFAEINEMIGE